MINIKKIIQQYDSSVNSTFLWYAFWLVFLYFNFSSIYTFIRSIIVFRFEFIEFVYYGNLLVWCSMVFVYRCIIRKLFPWIENNNSYAKMYVTGTTKTISNYEYDIFFHTLVIIWTFSDDFILRFFGYKVLKHNKFLDEDQLGLKTMSHMEYVTKIEDKYIDEELGTWGYGGWVPNVGIKWIICITIRRICFLFYGFFAIILTGHAIRHIDALINFAKKNQKLNVLSLMFIFIATLCGSFIHHSFYISLVRINDKTFNPEEQFYQYITWSMLFTIAGFNYTSLLLLAIFFRNKGVMPYN